MLYISPAGVDTNRCTSAATACATFNRAASLAACGSVVQVAPGTYAADQTFSETSTNRCAKAPVMFEPPPGSSNDAVTLTGRLDTWGASNLEFVGMTFSGGTPTSPYALKTCWNGNGGPPPSAAVSSRITFHNDHLTGKYAGWGSCGTDVTWRDGEIGPLDDPAYCGGSYPSQTDCPQYSTATVQIQELWACPSSSTSHTDCSLLSDAHGFAIADTTIHDIYKNNASDHQQCVFIGGVQGFLLQNDLIYNCLGNQGIFITNWCCSAHAPAQGRGSVPFLAAGIVQNNYIGAICDNDPTPCTTGAGRTGQGIALNSANGAASLAGPLVFSYNSTPDSIAALPEGQRYEQAGVQRIRGNVVGSYMACRARVTYDHNVQAFSGPTCGPSRDTRQSYSQIWMDWAGNPPDPSLRTGSAAIDAGTRSDRPRSDIRGRTRTCGDGTPDAGAYETCSGRPHNHGARSRRRRSP